MYKALDIAKRIIKFADIDTANGGDNMTNMKLQKMLYYQQGYHLAMFGKPLFEEDVEAWMYGPVVPVVYDHYCKNGSSPLPVENTDLCLEEQEEKLLYSVYDAYREFSAIGLMNKTHNEDPWKKSLPHDRGTVIPLKLMEDYFKTQL